MDPIADILTRIRNAEKAEKSPVIAPYSKMRHNVLNILKEKGFIEDVEVMENNKFKELKIGLKRESRLTLTKISKPGRRMYIKSKDIKKILGGLGISILSTPKGIMSSDQAKKLNLGGELLCEIY